MKSPRHKERASRERATQDAIAHGHDIGRWWRFGHVWTTECERCGIGFTVTQNADAVCAEARKECKP